MEISLDQFDNAIEMLYREIAAKIPDILQIQANDLKNKIRDRIQQKGLDATGSELPEYSESYRNAKAKRYGEISVEHRNYTATGNMWRELQITGVEDNATEVVVTVEGRTQDAKDKFDWNSMEDRRDILGFTEEEEAHVNEVVDEIIQEIIDENGF